MVDFNSYKKKYSYLEDSEITGIAKFFQRTDIVELLKRLEIRRKKTVLSFVYLLIAGGIGFSVFHFILNWNDVVSGILIVIGAFLIFKIGAYFATKNASFGRMVGFDEESIKETLLPEFVRAMGSNFRYASSPAAFSYFREMNSNIVVDEKTGLIIDGQSPDVLEIRGNIADAVDRISADSGILSKQYTTVFAEDSVQQFISTPEISGTKKSGILIESVEIEMKRQGRKKLSELEHCFLTKIQLNNPRFSFGDAGVLIESKKRKKNIFAMIAGSLMIAGSIGLMLFGWNTYNKAMLNPTMSGSTQTGSTQIPKTTSMIEEWMTPPSLRIQTVEARSRSSGGGSRSSGSRSSSSRSSSFSSAAGGYAAGSSISRSNTPKTPKEQLFGSLFFGTMLLLFGAFLLLIQGLGYDISRMWGKRKFGGHTFSRVNIDNPEFSKHYNVYAENPVMAMKILTNDFTWKILDFSKKLGKNSIYHFFFRGNTIWVKYDLLVSGVKDFMEFSMMKNMQTNVASYIEFFLEIKAVTSFAKEWNVFRLDAGMMQGESIEDRLSQGAGDTVFSGQI